MKFRNVKSKFEVGRGRLMLYQGVTKRNGENAQILKRVSGQINLLLQVGKQIFFEKVKMQNCEIDFEVGEGKLVSKWKEKNTKHLKM